MSLEDSEPTKPAAAMHKMQAHNSSHRPAAPVCRNELRFETTSIWRLKQSPNSLGSGKPRDIIQDLKLYQSDQRSHVKDTLKWESPVSSQHSYYHS